MAMISVGNRNLPEEIILSVESCEGGNFIVKYDYDGEERQETTFNPFDREDVRNLLNRRPELEKKSGGFSLEQLEQATSEVFAAHNEAIKLSHGMHDITGQWVFSNETNKWTAVDKDKATAIKKALQRSGYLQEVAAKLR